MTQPNTTTRRDLLRLGTSAAAYAAGAAIVTGAAALASEAKGATPGVSPELSRLIADHKEADDRINQFYRTTYNPAIDRHRAMTDAIPHVEREVPALSPAAPPLRWSTADPHTIGHPKSIALHPLEGQSQSPAWQARRREARSFYAAVLRRQRALAKAGRDSGAHAVAVREDELWVPIAEARLAIHNYPVASIADLAAKLAFIEDDNGMDGDDLLPLVMADVARLSGGEA